MPRAKQHIEYDKVERAVRNLLDMLHMDLKHPDLLDTPKRVAKMYIAELEPANDISNLLRAFPSDHDAMVTLVDHRTFTRCPHHLMPAELDISIAYIPNGKLLGLSKLARIADYFSRGFMLQEEIASGIADGLFKALEPKGVAVYIEGKHTCMRARGIKSTHSVTSTTCVRGCFDLNDRGSKEEFFKTIELSRGRK